MTPRQRLEMLQLLSVEAIRDAILQVVSTIVDGAYLKEIEAAVAANDPDRIYLLLMLNEAAFRPVYQVLQDRYEQFGDFTGQTYPTRLITPSGRVTFMFNARSASAETWLKTESSKLVTAIQDDVRVNIRNTIADGLARGQNPRATALDIVGNVDPQTGKRVGGIIGLTTGQEAWVRSTRAKLETLDPAYFELGLRDKRFDPTVQRAIDTGKPLPKETVDKLIGRYKASALKFRAEQIGRTETLSSLSASEYEAVQQVVKMGAAQPNDIIREWDDVGDNRTRHSHHLMHGQKVGLDEPFVSPVTNAMLMFPGDSSLGAPASEIVGCRCRVKTIVKWRTR